MNVLKTSRPRFWIYLLGPYSIGILAALPRAIDGVTELLLAIMFVYFLFPANLLLYGINDIFDYETDRLNAKKEYYESVVDPKEHKRLWLWIGLTNIPFLLVMLWTNHLALASFISFLLLGVFYSAQPIRAKTKPGLDSFFNILYIFPAFVGFTLAGGHSFSWPLVLAAFLWAMAMHAYSAIPDIESDRQAYMNTIATFLGKNGTLTLCTLFYVTSSIIAAQYLGTMMYILGLVYLWMMRKTFQAQTSGTILHLYSVFPKLNLISGFVIFWTVFYLHLYR